MNVNPETMGVIQRQIQSFREKFGRDPGPQDPIFFDPDADSPQPFPLERLQEQTMQAMVAADIRPEIIYAYHKTGLIVSEENLDKIPRKALTE